MVSSTIQICSNYSTLDSSTRVSSTLASQQAFPVVLTSVEGEFDSSCALRESKSSRGLSLTLLEIRTRVDILQEFAYLSTKISNPSSQLNKYFHLLTLFKNTIKYDNIRDYSTRSFYTCLLSVGYSP